MYALDRLECMSRSQLQSLFQLKSVRNANRVLYNMSPFLNHKRLHENVYYLSQKGRQHIGSEKTKPSLTQLEHKVRRNDIYLYYGCPKDWKVERPNEWRIQGEQYKLICDARFSLHGVICFVEVDLKQKMLENKKKIRLYRSLFQALGEQQALLIFYTTTQVRKERILTWCKEYKINAEILTIEDFENYFL